MDSDPLAKYAPIATPSAKPAETSGGGDPFAKYAPVAGGGGTGPSPPQGAAYKPWLNTPFDDAMTEVARTVVPPVVNFLDYPARAIAADIAGVTHGALPVDEASRKKFYDTREKSLELTRIPETPTGETISKVMGFPGAMIGEGAKALGKAVLGPKTAEAVGPIATVAGDVAPAALAARGAMSPAAQANVRPAATRARAAGYVLPPTSISDNPGLVANVLAGWSGKIKTQHAASARNQEVTNRLAAEGLGLPPDTVLTDQVFDHIRNQAGQAYNAVANAVPVINVDRVFNNAVAALGGRNGQAARMFPGIVRNPEIDRLITELSNAPQIPTPVAVELVRELRFNANNNFRAVGDPSRVALGIAQRQAAHALDDLMEREITNSGQPNLVNQYRDARQLIARSYDVEGATNTATGDVSARHLAGLAARGRPLTGELDTIADAATAFPKAMQAPAGFGYDQPWSALDILASTGALAAGHPGAALTVLGRHVGRDVLLSEPFQQHLTNRVPDPARRGAAAGLIAQPHDDTYQSPQHSALGIQ